MGSEDHYRPKHQIRVVTATSLFDGHDAAINVMRRLIQQGGAEVIHLGHNRSVDEIVEAAVQEDVQAIAVSSYQGGHNEFFKYMYDRLTELDSGHIRITGGGGGVIRPDEIEDLHNYGIEKIYSPEDGRKNGLEGMISDLLSRSDFHTINVQEEGEDRSGDPFMGMPVPDAADLSVDSTTAVARMITLAETGLDEWKRMEPGIKKAADDKGAPVIGITGTGGAGKSSLLDEIVMRFRTHNPDSTVAVLSADPSKKRTGGALLGDRIRMNAVHGPGCYMRSLACRGSNSELPTVMMDAIKVVQAAGFDLVLVETAGIGQGDTEIVDICDISMYVMTTDFGAHTQLEKIDMIDFADIIVINKFERRGSKDALKAVRRQFRRSRNDFDSDDEALPVFGTIASHFNDAGVNSLYVKLCDTIEKKLSVSFSRDIPQDQISMEGSEFHVFPPDRVRYLGEIADTVRNYRKKAIEQADAARKRQHLATALAMVTEDGLKKELQNKLNEAEAALTDESRSLLEGWDGLRQNYSGDSFTYQVRGRDISVKTTSSTLAGTSIRRVIVPDLKDHGDRVEYLMLENVPGSFPFTAGVFPFKREGEDPKRMFAGEGGPEKTNARFHYLCRGEKAKRLSTAFDSVTLYGQDPDPRPDILGKVGESGVSICTLDDIKMLYHGFELCNPMTSVSMTINGPAPIMLAFFMNAAIDQQVDKYVEEHGEPPTPEKHEEIRLRVLENTRGTVQADILKEDQAQNTCIFSTEFALKMMGDIQEYFIDNKVRNFYSVSISGYHIAEAGANPVTQTALTLSNGFTYVEYYLSRGFPIDSFAPNLSYFFSNGMDAEYAVIGRVARRIWSVAMREMYGAGARSQQLKYHIQTSGRSLHAQEIQFNDIRTTLQALLAFYDNCNSLHTNSYDEAVTTPTEESVRRAMAIQLITLKEFGISKNENPWQGSYIMEELTELVEEAILSEFERISERGGVLGAMEMQYQRGRIQDESMLYEYRKHTGELPVIGVNTYLNPDESCIEAGNIELRRSTEDEKKKRLDQLSGFHARHKDEAASALEKVKQVALEGGNIFSELMNAARVCSLGQLTCALYDVGGKYRRNM